MSQGSLIFKFYYLFQCIDLQLFIVFIVGWKVRLSVWFFILVI